MAPPFRRLSGLSRATVAVLYVFAAITAVNLVGAALYLGELSGYSGSEPWDVATDTAAFVIYLVSTILQALLYLALIVLFIVWYYRAYSNLQALGIVRPRYGKGWAIGAWFIPVFNWIRCKQIANDIWRAGEPEAPAWREPDWFRARVPDFMHWWWAAWIAGDLTANLAGNLGLSGDVDQEELATQIDLVSAPLHIAAALLAAHFLRRAGERQDERSDRLRESGVNPAQAPYWPPVQPGYAQPPPAGYGYPPAGYGYPPAGSHGWLPPAPPQPPPGAAPRPEDPRGRG